MADAVEKRYTLKEAAAHFYDGRVTNKTLRNEFQRHNLLLECVGGKFFCTASDIAALRAATKRLPGSKKDKSACRDQDSPPASTFGAAEAIVEPPGSFSTDRKKLAQAQALATVQRLRSPSKTTLPAATSRRVVPIAQASSSFRKS